MSIQVLLGQCFFLFGLVWLLDGRSAVFALPCVFRVCGVLKGVYKIFFWFGLVFKEKPLVGWLIPLAIVCLEREESMRSWMQVLDAGFALYV